MSRPPRLRACASTFLIGETPQPRRRVLPLPVRTQVAALRLEPNDHRNGDARAAPPALPDAGDRWAAVVPAEVDTRNHAAASRTWNVDVTGAPPS